MEYEIKENDEKKKEITKARFQTKERTDTGKSWVAHDK